MVHIEVKSTWLAQNKEMFFATFVEIKPALHEELYLVLFTPGGATILKAKNLENAGTLTLSVRKPMMWRDAVKAICNHACLTIEGHASWPTHQ